MYMSRNGDTLSKEMANDFNVAGSHTHSSHPVTCICQCTTAKTARVQKLCEGRGGRPGLSVLTSLAVSVDVKQH